MGWEKRSSAGTILYTVVGVLLLALMLFLVYTQANRFLEMRSQVEQEMIALEEDEEYLLQLIQLRKDAPEIEERIAKAEGLIPPLPKEDLLLQDLSHLADISEIELLSVRFGKRTAKNGYEEMPMDLTFDARYHGLLTLLDHLQNWNRSIRINDVKIGQGKGGFPRISVNISTTAFYLQEKEGEG